MVDPSGGLDPYLFFSTAAGPDASDVFGPPQGALDLYADGSPVAGSESRIANAIGGGGAPFFARPDVHALALLIIGSVMVHLHMEA
jgi:hypothetical protein